MIKFGDREKGKIATLSAISNHDLLNKNKKLKEEENELICSLFEISLNEEKWEAYIKREHRYEFKMIPYFELNNENENENEHGKPDGNCLVCCQSTDSYYKNCRCISNEIFYEKVGQHYQGKIWFHTRENLNNQKQENDNFIQLNQKTKLLPIKPIYKYLHFCLCACKELNDICLHNFIHNTLMCDGKTKLIHYLEHFEPDLYNEFC
jgi:hypothetical protein